MADSSTPVLSFPAVLRNSGLTSRFAHLQPLLESGEVSGSPGVTKRFREEREGKRWLRRKDNAGFVGNPHIVVATKPDYILPVPQTRPTFPEPLPHYLPRTVKVPSASFPTTNIASANAGRFSVSMKGMRRDLRRAGGKAEWLVRDVETAIVEWLMQGGTVLRPNSVEDSDLQESRRMVGHTGTIIEVSRTPLQLIWRIPDDAFARYVVHCCARYHEVVSFSKGTDQNRLTYLLRPNVTRPDRRILAALETPPVTEIEISSNPDTDIDSDFVSEQDLESDVELDHKANLPSIAEGPSLHIVHEDNLSTLADGEETEFLDVDYLDSGSEIGSDLEGSVDFLQARLKTLSVDPAPIQPTLATPVIAEQPFRMDEGPDTSSGVIHSPPINPARRRKSAAARSPSSPSRSPVRLRRRRRTAPKKRIALSFQAPRSFYDYLFR